MMKAKNSLEENKEEILANLPKEFHGDFLKSIEEMPETQDTPLQGEAVVAAIKAELVANPDVDESAAAAELKEIKAPESVAPVSEKELEAQKAEMLAAAKEQAEK